MTQSRKLPRPEEFSLDMGNYLQNGAGEGGGKRQYSGTTVWRAEEWLSRERQEIPEMLSASHFERQEIRL